MAPSSVNRSKLKTCRNFSATGRCHYGSSCKFSHDASVQSPQTLSQDANISRNQVNEGFRQWTFFVPRGKIARPLGSELSKFFSQALGLVYEDVELRQGVVTRLAEEGGLQRIKELTQTIEASSLQSTENQLRVFNDQVIPFLEILSNQDVGSSLVLENHVATIHNFLFGPSGTRGVFFYNFIAVTVAECFKQPTVADSGAKEKLEACCVTFSHILDLKGSAPVPEEFSTILTKLVDCLNKLSPGDRQNAHRTCHVLERAGRRLNTTLGIIGPAEPVKNPAERSAFHLDKDGPGELSAEGTRHDNDRHDIRKIQIMPTASEINSRRSDYLPCADSTSWHIRGRDGFLDRQFRMLREDTVGQLRDAIRFEIERDSDAAAAQRLQSKYKQAALRHVYKDASLRTLDWRERDGLIMTFQFMQPAPLRNMTVNERSVWWASSKRLSEGALVCLLDGHGSAIFCSVVSNGMSAVPKPGSNPNTTRIMPPNFNVYQDRRIAYVALTPVESDVDSVEVILNHYSITEQALEKLIEFPGIMIPSLYPTLKALQDRVGKEDLPFDEIWGSKTSEEAIDVAVPRYASSDGFQFELGSILLNGAQLTLSPKEVFDPTALQTQSSLDPAQSKSLINALQREVALIQGPPGTGKSYTGVALIKVLLANASKASMGPIICVCYTNHALDQLLEHLLDHGVQQIIRIGSRSKSERLDDVNLNEISRRAEKTKTEKSTLHEAFEQIEEKLKDIKKLLEQFSRAGSIGTIKHHLRSQQPHHYSQLFDTDGDSQGFKQVHRKQDNELKAWLRGHCHREDADRKPLSLDSLRRLSLQSLTHEERKILYNGWISDYRSYVQERILHLVTDYMRAKSSKSNVHSELDLRCLKQANVVGLTTSGLARVQKMLGLLNSKVLICEEAGEILEAHTLATLLPSIEHMILIGDHQQLRPQINDYNLQKVNPRGEQFSFDVSLFERLIEPNETTAIRLPFDTLTTQRRMHPSISALIRVNSYEALQDHASVETYPKVVGVRHRLFWFDHDHHEEEAEPDQPTNKSHTNNYEVDMTSSLVEHVIKQGSYAKCDVAVLTPYLGQMRKLRRGLSGSFVIALNERDEAEAQAKGIDLGASSEQPTLVSQRSLADAIRLSTVDNFQGEEAKIVIISLVRCNERNRCGFLSTSNRINVLLSRAQHGMYIIGCSETYRHVPYWANVISQLQENGNIGKRIELECPRHPETVIDVSCPDDFSIFAPEEIKGMQVDFLEYKTYSEVDLDDDPCVIPRCGHILTKENMDGHFALNKYYEFSADGAITDIKDASLPFSYQDDMKCCPTCRGSLRDLSRYGRLVRRALLDESTKRLVSWAHQTYLALEDTLEGIQKSLADKATKPAILSDLVILGTAQEQIKVVSGIKTFRQANAVALSFRTEIKKFLSKVRLEEQPFHKVSAMVKNHHRRTGIEPTSLPNDIGTVQLRHALLAAALLLRVDLCIIAAAVASFQAGKTERLGAGSRLTLDLAHNRRTCANLIEDANKARQPCVEADAHILFALYAALEASATGRSDVEPDQPSSTARLSSSTALRENGMSHIDTAERICGDHPSETMAVTSELQKAKDALQKLEFYATITSEERRQVLKAMQSEFRGTGHWYTCENMHPFSIGECGMPMQQARCPQCGSPIGGQRHQAAEGVQRAVEFDQEITDLARGVADM
ncbi:MAG: hypothetical protein M1828_004105 [Chrysothrix sp. TS-e1954]|nr:MAG: hypothetical protein M1828_004105 [Chrysothrix sp. TS-e1954]